MMQKSIMDRLLGIVTLSVDLKHDRLKEAGEFYLLSVLSFFVPFMISSQIFTGIMVNMSLIGGALYLKGRNILPVMILPSIGVLSRGIIFGPLTYYLIYMLPFIWLGNAILIVAVKFIHLKMKKPYIAATIAGSFTKFTFLFSSAFLLYQMGIIPVEFMAAMGIMQLVTAASASFAFFPINIIRKRK